MTTSDYASITREMYIDASPDIVFQVVSTPEHIAGWWTDQVDFDQAPGGSGFVAFGDLAEGGKRVEFSVADAIPNRLFSFRWSHEPGMHAVQGNSNLVTFELIPEGAGTRLKFTEIGFVERGWGDDQVAETYADHSSGWDHFLAKLVPYAEGVGASA
jgi:uncharacterized protein YndB with AHSA1/START domain